MLKNRAPKNRAHTGNTYTIISRESPLAKVQVEELKAHFPKGTFAVEYTASLGDKNLNESLLNGSVSGDFFTRELDNAVLSGAVDLAVHSAKDLPFPLPKGLQVIALLEAQNQSDSLVARDGLTLAALPKGAKLGTSSPSRQKQIIAMRPDLEIVSIRGDIAQRIAYVERKECDAIIVATCALDRLGLRDRATEELTISTHPLQGNLAVVAQSGRYDLEALLAPLDSRRKLGEVTLVGAGPGDPELITRKGERLIGEADIVFYDALIDDELITWINGEKVFVGKRKGEHYRSQTEINELLYQAAKSGKKVVRLKCGDPLLFSRGGEEIDYLQERLVSVAVVPAVSSFQGCAASLTMPLTKRGVARSLTTLSAHYESPAEIPVTKSGTQIIFMGASKTSDIQEALLNKGWSKLTPLSVISRGTYDDEQIFVGTIDTLDKIEAPAPAMIIIGEVTAPLQPSKKVLFTGLDPSRLAVSGQIIHQPLIELSAIEDFAEALTDLSAYDGYIFTSKAAVEFFFDTLSPTNSALFTGVTRAASIKIVAVGPHTAKEIERRGVQVDFIPETADAEHLAELIANHTETSTVKKWLYPCSNRSKNKLHTLANVQSIILYTTQTKKVVPLLLDLFEAIVFSSPSTVDGFIANYGPVPSAQTLLVYGEPTAKRLRDVGIAENRIVITPILAAKE